ncbi:MAG: hypothetical protein HY544_04300 [Candidatus Diapherotrites archaeon]|uniref:Uncharacterized protein n=1 Tax=Candidatus Iainarchaeum sp. TaxID=3101447 RepID=A0A8T3YNV1_9ARCH|nr:hypothetical protein [Candidatus Diapherotrites archaeon]
MDKRQVLKDSIVRLLQLNISDKEILDNLRAVGIDMQLAKGLLDETKAELSGRKVAQQGLPEGWPGAGQQAKQPQPVQPGPSDAVQRKVPEKPPQVAPAQSQGKAGRPFFQFGGQPAQKPQPVQAGKAQVREKPDAKAHAEAKDEGPMIPDDEDIYSDADEEEEPLVTPVKGKQINNPGYSAGPDESVSELWEKGILSTVDAKLGEMKRIKAELDAVLEQKISEKVALESKKVEILLDSQRALFTNKIDAHLEARSNEVMKVVEARAREMQDIHTKVQAELAKVQGEKKFNTELLNSLNERLAGLDAVKSQMISETNGSIMGMESKFGEFMRNAERSRGEDEDKLNRALQLHEKITEGTLEDLRQKISSMRLEKEQELGARVQSKLAQLDQLTAQVDPKGITDRLASLKELEQQLMRRGKEIDLQVLDKKREMRDYIDSLFQDMRRDMAAFTKEVSKSQADNLAALKKQYSESVDELFSENLLEWDKKLKAKKKEIDELEKRIDVDKFNASLDSLDLFKQQFLNTVKRSIEDYNKSKKGLAEGMIAKDKAINDYLGRIDAKMQELSDFQKKFSADVAELLGKIPEDAVRKKRKGRKG